ncbi:MAG: radical SAM protein [Sulfuricaulis sp.]
MANWQYIAAGIEALEGLSLQDDLVAELENRGALRPSVQSGVHFYTPTFKSFQTSEIHNCGRNVWPAVSITGSDCKLQCDHCKAKILEPMIPARTPDDLWQVVHDLIADGAQGMLLTGGSNHRNVVEYDPYYPVIRRIKDTWPSFKIAVHTALVDTAAAQRMEHAGIDVAMMDVIGAQETITQVYHLKRTVEDFERTLEALVATNMKVVPHIVIGLHYGRLLGEWNALEMIRRHRPDALVLVVVMPMYATPKRPFATPDPHEVGRFFLEAREALPDIPLLLGCARPPGMVKVAIDAYAIMAGINGMAHPSEGIVELAARLHRPVRVTPACCSIAVGDEVMALETEDNSLALDIATILKHEAQQRRLKGIRVVSESAVDCRQK